MTSIATTPSQTSEFKSSSNLQTKRHAASSVTIGQDGISDTNEARYWTQKLGLGSAKYSAAKRKFAQPKTLMLSPKGPAIVNQVLFGPPLNTKNSPLAVVSGPRVSLYGTSPSSNFFRSTSRHTSSLFGNKIDPDRQVQTGGNVAHCGAFRNDGRLLAVGTEVGDVRVCDVTMRATLATFKASTLPVRSLQWFRNGQFLLAGGDDGLARIWNLGSTDKRKPILTLAGHGDVIRSTALWQRSETSATTEWTQLAITGSYDHTIRVWNVKDPDVATDEDRCISILSHGFPVEALCLMESQDPDVPVWLLSVGGTTMKVWNPISGQCNSTVSTQHRKTITSLQAVVRSNLSDDTKTKSLAWRILTSSLDGLLQFHSWDPAAGTLDHLYSTALDYAISSVVADPTGDRLAIGTTTGEVVVKVKGPSTVATKRAREPFAGTYSFFQRGMNADADAGDYTVASQGKKRKLRSFDVALKQFRYGDALDDALATRRPKDVVAVLEELGKRRGLEAALSNRDEELLEPVLSFTTRYINRPHYTSLLVGIAHKLIDIYGDVTGQSEMIDELFAKLKAQVGNECRAQASLLQLVGQIDCVMAASEFE
eukprot:CAMPEP_0117012646 /NCGR_PEP_ID=MMETSP0472-20121206/10600_1 /TAXON_ID=693140 ORGANISM="Tiarina fusus, Strain LIS" /NCGR_SAMPLE_ID=MMETSP0472 /ASSEMBLY_ACC=CAM_ASM_000603 /LENGTH=595 /DNA_ID=CAMNT_0004715771 /DNA_START=158 /DNA_END=1942 /DNA_ORIENTATION=-